MLVLELLMDSSLAAGLACLSVQVLARGPVFPLVQASERGLGLSVGLSRTLGMLVYGRRWWRDAVNYQGDNYGGADRSNFPEPLLLPKDRNAEGANDESHGDENGHGTNVGRAAAAAAAAVGAAAPAVAGASFAPVVGRRLSQRNLMPVAQASGSGRRSNEQQAASQREAMDRARAAMYTHCRALWDEQDGHA